MTEPPPSPIPTTPSGQSWLGRIGPLDDLLKDHPSVTLAITAVALPLLIWLGKRAWKTWKRKRHAQRVAARRQQLPSVHLPFTVEVGNQRLTLEPAQPQQNFAPEGMWTARCFSDSACFVLQAAFFRSRNSLSTSSGVRYPRAE